MYYQWVWVGIRQVPQLTDGEADYVLMIVHVSPKECALLMENMASNGSPTEFKGWDGGMGRLILCSDD